MDRETRTKVANTIIEQLGGQARLKMMIGANTFVALDTPNGGVSFRIPSNLSRPRINVIRIVLNGMDTYDLEFRSMRGGYGNPSDKLVAAEKDVYCDQLRSTIERNTGLVLIPPRLYADSPTQPPQEPRRRDEDDLTPFAMPSFSRDDSEPSTPAPEPFSGRGGTFSGAGASDSWDSPSQASSSPDPDPAPTSTVEDSSSSSDSNSTYGPE